ncbi:helix-turn-helix transcriptional regulator [Haliscomenobacter sp.]|uniref:helix-turn-helix domain-containing protein n=1 Tax=Haliscomenobacter sp. TaxID=2717303 RepID=UPI0033650DD8
MSELKPKENIFELLQNLANKKFIPLRLLFTKTSKNYALRIMTLYENMRKIRLLKSLKQTTVASRLGVSQSTYHRIEQGMQAINEETIEKIAQALGVGQDVLRDLDKHFLFFNNIETQSGGEVQNHVYGSGLTPTEKELYQARIAQLEEEVRFLKKIIEERL